jgi:hypothetical protein
MYETNGSRSSKCVLAIALLWLLMVGGQLEGQTEDPHRPACTSAQCKQIKSFVKAHYCGKTQGNGPDDSCEIRHMKTLGTDIKVVADFECEWVQDVRKCQQHKQPSSKVRSILVGELRRLGLPDKRSGEVFFNVWESPSSGWSLAEAYYDHLMGSDLTLSQVIAIIDQSSRMQVLRKVPFQKTDADKPTVTTWSLVDIADVDGDGHPEVILEGDAYENHWLEVESVQNGLPHTIFSGLGY